MLVNQVENDSRQVLVTGGAGYVGARLVPSLIENGYHVRVLDTCWYGTDVFGDFANNPMLELVVGDIRDRDTVNAVVIGCTDVIHLACISNDPSYDLNPLLGEEINFTAFEPLVQAAKAAGVGRIAEAIGFRPKFTINDAVADLQRAFVNGDLPNSLTDPTYFNIRRMNEILDAADSDGKS
jgi:hypothetical protein